MDARETPVAKPQKLQHLRYQLETCTLAFHKPFILLLHILASAPYCYPKTEKAPEIHLTSSQKVLYGINKPSSKIQDKQLNEIQYEFEAEDDPAPPSYHQMQEQNSSTMLNQKVLIIHVYQW